MRSIVIINKSTLVTPADFLAAIRACQLQVSRDFSPLWSGLFVQLLYYPGEQPASVASESITLVDDADQAGALGYHTDPADGIPRGYCFVRTTQQAGERWEGTLSHELLEQLADPDCTRGVVAMMKGKVALCDYETCDPVEADSYLVNGIPLSNFVLPAWWDANSPAGSKYDFLGKLNAPLTMTAGGYISYSSDLKHWQEVTAHRKRPHRIAPHPVLSRHARRARRRGGLHA